MGGGANPVMLGAGVGVGNCCGAFEYGGGGCELGSKTGTDGGCCTNAMLASTLNKRWKKNPQDPC